jgi:hypothetical protein
MICATAAITQSQKISSEGERRCRCNRRALTTGFGVQRSAFATLAVRPQDDVKRLRFLVWR